MYVIAPLLFGMDFCLIFWAGFFLLLAINGIRSTKVTCSLYLCTYVIIIEKVLIIGISKKRILMELLPLFINIKPLSSIKLAIYERK